MAPDNSARAARMAASQTRALVAAWTAASHGVFARALPADRVLAEHLQRHHELGGRDRRLIGEIVHGIFRWWGWVGVLAPAADTPAESDAWTPLFLAAALASAESPASVHMHWAQRAGLPPETLPALFARDGSALRLAKLWTALGRPEPPTTLRPERLLPEWCPAEVCCPHPLPELVEWLQRRPPLWLRLQADQRDATLQALREAGLNPQPHDRMPDAAHLGAARVHLQTLEPYRDGRVEVQDISSQAVAVACGARTGERWWDVCAGAGGKTLVLARGVGAQGGVVATDIRSDALAELQRRARRAGIGNIKIGSPKSQPDAGVFDGVLVDAPCSGSGTWRRSPWARWQLKREALADYARRQTALLHEAARAVKPGGLLVYATCSLFRAENADVVMPFLSAHPEFVLTPFTHPLTGAMTDGALQIWPWDADGDAMFVACLRRSQK